MYNSRRSFIKKSAIGAAGTAIGGMGFSAKSYASILGANERFRIAVCGVNGRGKSHINGFGQLKNVEIAYLVDPDRLVLENRVAEVRENLENSSRVKGVADVRHVLDDKNIDAISVATPNNWHSLMVIWARSEEHTSELQSRPHLVC